MSHNDYSFHNLSCASFYGSPCNCTAGAKWSIMMSAKPSDVAYCYIGQGTNRYRVERHRTEFNVLFTLHRVDGDSSTSSARRTFGDLMWSIFACVDVITPDEYAALYALREAE